MEQHNSTTDPARNPSGRPGQHRLRSGPLVAGGILAGTGAVVAVAGLAVAGRHVVTATRAWIKELETPPGQLGRLRWAQAKAALAAGATAWRAHPHAHVHLVRRTSPANLRG